jgi:hypothetical protein
MGIEIVSWMFLGLCAAAMIAAIIADFLAAVANSESTAASAAGLRCAHGVHKLRGSPCVVCHSDLVEPVHHEPAQPEPEPEPEPGMGPPKSFKLHIPPLKYGRGAYYRMILDFNAEWTAAAREILMCRYVPMNPVYAVLLHGAEPSTIAYSFELKCFCDTGGWIYFPMALGISRVSLEADGNRLLDLTPTQLVARQAYEREAAAGL